MMVSNNVAQENVGVAFALVIGSGMATALGASVVFFPSLVKLASRRVLASGLGFSAGVMTYISFTEIIIYSVRAFQNQGMSDFEAHGFAALCFIAGVVCMVAIDFILKCLNKHQHKDHHHDKEGGTEAKPVKTAEVTKEQPDDVSEKSGHSFHNCVCCMEDPGGELEEWQRRAREEEEAQQSKLSLAECCDQSDEEKTATTTKHSSDSEASAASLKPKSPFNNKTIKAMVTSDEGGATQEVSKVDDDVSDVSESNRVDAVTESHEDQRLITMGFNTALAIGIHNFPEGLATFVSALADAKVGAVLAVAIGIHNIPEGLCVAMPIYYATGNRCKAFAWGVLSGLSEPVAALLGYLVLANVFNDIAYAVLFGITSGMMVIISMKELLPTAHRYDDQDTVVTYSFIFGMFVMAVSLVLFQI